MRKMVLESSIVSYEKHMLLFFLSNFFLYIMETIYIV